MNRNETLNELGIVLPPPAAKGGLYAPVRVCGNLAYVSGQTPTKDGKFMMTGVVGAELSLEDAQVCAKQCAINTLAALNAHFGDLEQIKGCVKLFGLVRCTPEFEQQPAVINAASQVMIDVFGEEGWHARSAVGTNALPFGVPVEIESIFELK